MLEAQTDAVPLMDPAAAGNAFTVTGKAVENAPVPQPLTAATVRLPFVALALKAPVMLAVLPEGVKPVPV